MGGIPNKKVSNEMCSLCGESLRDSGDTSGLPVGTTFTAKEVDNSKVKSTNVISLNCGHRFHEFCIRGWTIVGKKDTCPFCKEKVDLKRLARNPWETQSLVWSYFLDFLRYLIVWNPAILVVTQIALYIMETKIF
eukprot:TRINITY_DN9142_c1_g1_i5.p1 TRINITY_DN9142_c1_g1~~TRINITY_DN9142_c1_g1_i5.p1  ORF type:complete len:135 (+),score=19.31 TRINITY_DN9142_c1_g1_i5:43-447(+)